MPTAAEIIAMHTVEEGTFEIDLGGNPPVVFTVRNIKSVPELAKVRRRAQELVKLSSTGNVPPEWKPFLPISEEVAEIVAKLTNLVIEPKFSDTEALELCAKAGMFASFLHSQILMRLAHVVLQTEASQLDDAKNAFGVTEEETIGTSSAAPSGETTSSSDATTSTNTPTTSPTPTGDTPATS